jgi:threonine/homoserine/homoserine lactone efflux protein
VSALVMASAEAFTALKLVGAVYLVWLGVKAWREARIVTPLALTTTNSVRALRDGIVVEALNPKTAAFFLAFIPQFVDASRPVAGQFIVLGLLSVSLNTTADIVVACWAGMARARLGHRAMFMVRARQASGIVLCGLGASLLVARRCA